MRNPQRLPGSRAVRTSLDEAEEPADSAVVACPPHPQFGGDRHDSRLTAVGEAVATAGFDCLRIDYGDWDEGRGERADALTALEWTSERYERVALFGYSFGATVALAAAVETSTEPTASQPVAVSALAPAAEAVAGFDPGTLDRIDYPGQVVYGERDDTATWQPIVERANELGWAVEAMPADHFFVSQRQRVGNCVTAFLTSHL